MGVLAVCFLAVPACDRDDLRSGPAIPAVTPPPPPPPPPPCSALKVKINEWMVLNSTTLEDETGDFPPWIEIYNNSDTDYNLAGVPLSAGEAYRQFIKEFLHGNKLVRGELELGGRKVDMKNLTMPILSIYAERDHLVPPACTVAMKKYVDNDDYTELCIKTGHIGIYTGGASQKILAPGVAKWLKEH
jgi:pimeloyl-ACP methyl ester carboxylesterase